MSISQLCIVYPSSELYDIFSQSLSIHNIKSNPLKKNGERFSFSLKLLMYWQDLNMLSRPQRESEGVKAIIIDLDDNASVDIEPPSAELLLLY